MLLEYNKMIAIVSSEGEEIKLERPVRAEGSVETWLMSLLQSAQGSLHSIIRNAVSILNDPAFNMLMFLDKMPAQVDILKLLSSTVYFKNSQNLSDFSVFRLAFLASK